MELRDYQKECKEIVDQLPDGSRSIVALATGLGKTYLASSFETKGRILWLSHRDELVRQPERYFKERGLSFGIEKAQEHANGEDVISASVQTLCRESRLSSYQPDEFDIIICDEAHHAAAPSYKTILGYFHPRKLIGLTATPKRGDNVRLDDVFDSICFTRDLKWGIEHGYLSPIRSVEVDASFDMNKVAKMNGDFAPNSLESNMIQSNNDMVVTKAYHQYCLPERKQTLIYCPTIAVCKLLLQTMRASLAKDGLEHTVEMLSDRNTKEQRADILRKYKERRINCIINCMILTEGTDLPDTSVIINNRPSANISLYQQIVGRGTRLAEGKDYCLVIDVVGENSQAKSLCTAPTLFGVDGDFLTRESKRRMQEVDLLEFCDAFLAERAQTALSAELKIQTIDLFIEERENLISLHTKNGGAALADAYQNAIAEKQDAEYDFGDIVVFIQPEDKHYFCIKATYNGRIYLSKPDLLNQTVIEFDIPKEHDMEEFKVISQPMPMQEAVTYIAKILKYGIPKRYQIVWSKKARKEAEQYNATRKQEYRARMICRDLSVKKSDTLSKRQASDLIELDLELQNLRQRHKAANNALEDANKKRRGKIKERYLQKQAQESERYAKEQRTKEEKFDTVFNGMLSVSEENRKKEEAMFKKENEMASTTQYLPVNMSYQYYPNNGKPSQRQKDFVESLPGDVKRQGMTLNANPVEMDLDMWSMGAVISCLLQIKDIQFKHHTAIFDIVTFAKEAKRISEDKTPQIKPKQVKCPYDLSAIN